MRLIECHPNPDNATEAEFRVAMDAAPNKRSSIRLNAIRVLLLGYDRKSVCEIFARSDRMVRLWIHAFNQSGIEGLISKPRTGRPRKVKLQKIKDLLIPVLEDPSKAGEIHWTGVKIHGFLTEKLSMELGYRTTIRWLHEMDFNLRVPQPWPFGQKEEDRQVFKEKMQQWSNDPDVEFWFCDESGIEGDPRPRRRWVQPGKTRTSPYLGKHIRQNVIGAVAPQSGALFSLIVNGVDKRGIPILFGSNGQGYTEKDWQAPTADYGQRFLAQVQISGLASFRTCVFACLFSGFQSHRTIVAATEGRLVL